MATKRVTVFTETIRQLAEGCLPYLSVGSGVDGQGSLNGESVSLVRGRIERIISEVDEYARKIPREIHPRGYEAEDDLGEP